MMRPRRGILTGVPGMGPSFSTAQFLHGDPIPPSDTMVRKMSSCSPPAAAARLVNDESILTPVRSRSMEEISSGNI